MDPERCYRHPDRPTGLRCTRCDRPICPEDAIEAPVGHQCPDCVRAARTTTRRAIGADRASVTTGALTALIVVAGLTAVARGPMLSAFGLVPAAVGAGEWWRLLTGALLHAGVIHLAFNGLFLWRLGTPLEQALGHARFAALLVAGAAGGALGVVATAWLTVASGLGRVPLLGPLLGTSPRSLTVGASGAVFALMGTMMAAERSRGLDPWRTEIGGLVLVNLVITLAVPAISIGGHVGGLVTGWSLGRVLVARGRRPVPASVVLTVAAGLVVIGWSLARASLSVLP